MNINNKRLITKITQCTAVSLILTIMISHRSRADVVTDWNAVFEASLTPGAERGPRVPARTVTMLHAAIFDTVNGITRKYERLHASAEPRPGARAEAAAIQAAYRILSSLRPEHQELFDAQFDSSLEGVPGSAGNSQSILRGLEYGEAVAREILAWRGGDGPGELPPFVGSNELGFWRHPPNENAPTAGYANLGIDPFLLPDPLAFDPGPPYGLANRADALASEAYAADVNELKRRGGLISVERTADEAAHALFNNTCDLADLNRLLRSIADPSASLTDNARLFALFNMAAFDTTVVMFRVKYLHEFWRPFQAIHYAALDNNPLTEADPGWMSLLPTPPHPEYISAHVTFFTSMLRVAQRLVGETGEVELSASATGEAYLYQSLQAISDPTVDSRVDIGYHFRQTCLVSQTFGAVIGDYVVDHALQPLHGSWQN